MIPIRALSLSCAFLFFASSAQAQETTPAATEAPPASAVTLRVQRMNASQRFSLRFETPEGPFSCRVPPDADCVLRLRAPGSVLLHAESVGSFSRTLELTEGPSILQLAYRPAARGLVPGILLIGTGLALGGATAGLVVGCGTGTACGSDFTIEPLTAVAIPLGIASVAAIVLGAWMLPWSRPEEITATVLPDFQ